MRTEIITKVAEYIRNPETKKKIEDGERPVVRDTFEFSEAAAEKLKNSQKFENQIEKERFQNVENLRTRVESNNYNLNEDMVSSIAEKIIQLL
jgi:hypothetical protein